MNSKFYLTILALFLSAQLYAQSSDEISFTKTFGGYKFEQYGKSLTPRQMLQVMEVDPEAYEYMKRAKTNYDAGQVVGFVGGALIGWQIGALVGGGEPNWAVAGIGAGVLLVGIPLGKGYNTNALRAVEIYNSYNQGELAGSKVKLQFGLTNHGVGLALKL